MIENMVPDAVSPGFALILVVASFFTSAMTASMGIGGGVLMLAIMAYGLSVAALIPVHGAAQFGSNLGRFFLQRRHVAWGLLFAFSAGGAVGALAGVNLVVQLPEALMMLFLGGFILAVTWLPIPRLQSLSARGFAVAGLVTTCLSMFVGATGPLNAAIFGRTLVERRALVATLAAVMSVQHILKVAGFAFAGFAFAEWLPLILAMIVIGFAGTYVGTTILSRLPEALFRTGMRLVLTLMAVDLIRRAIF